MTNEITRVFTLTELKASTGSARFDAGRVFEDLQRFSAPLTGSSALDWRELDPSYARAGTPAVDIEINRFLVENDKGIADALDFFVRNLSFAMDWWGKVNAGLTPWLE